MTLTKKIPNSIDKTIARRLIKRCFSWEVVINNPEVIIQASEIEENYKISFWDSLIVSAAFSQNAATILTGNLNHGQYIEGIIIKNPFLT